MLGSAATIMKLLPTLMGSIKPIIDRFIHDPDIAQQLEYELKTQMLQQDTSELEARMQIILAEAQSKSWLPRNVRPLFMLCVTAILFNNYILAPYVDAFLGTGVYLELPPALWGLFTVAVGGYIGSRGIEKVTNMRTQAAVGTSPDAIY